MAAGAGKVLMGLAGLLMGVQGVANSADQLNQGLKETLPPRPPPRRRSAPGVAGLGLTAPVGRAIAPPSPHRGSVGKAQAEGSLKLTQQSIGSLAERVRYIRGRITKGIQDPQIYALARKITSKRGPDGNWLVKEKDNIGEARLIFAFVRKNVRYTSDTYGVDTFAVPRVSLGLHAGDCDDYTVILACLLLSVGIPVNLVIVATKNGARNVGGVLLPNPDHIFLEAGFPRGAPTQWIGLDASVDVPFGWQVPDNAIVKKWKAKPTL